MAIDLALTPTYRKSSALIIGINRYEHVAPLLHARNDAVAIAQCLTERFGFPKDNVDLLLDEKATRAGIHRAFMKHAAQAPEARDDRLLFFFAGHGHTFSGNRRESGFLVPVDGRPDELGTLLPWDDLVRACNLIPAKHVFFIIDACYGGLAFSRKALPPGTSRFLKDMLQRYGRQLLTSGKEDETVSDGGSSRAGHSIFTGIVLDGLEGAAATATGFTTASSLMAYVYNQVATSGLSEQTPHYGYLEGDGDFIFDVDLLDQVASTDETGSDVLLTIPAIGPAPLPMEKSIGDAAKELIGDRSKEILLDDFVTAHLRRAIERLATPDFPARGKEAESDTFAGHVDRYEKAVADIQVLCILLARWGSGAQLSALAKILARLAEADKVATGQTRWIRLAWYPTLYLMYSAGIAALAGQNYEALRICLTTPVQMHVDRDPLPIVLQATVPLVEIADEFKQLPGQERKYVPRSEHMFTALQPPLEDLLFLGRSYESLFDQFEILLALVYADLRREERGRIWGPPGRFAWKMKSGDYNDFFRAFVDSIARNPTGGPLGVGLFQGDATRLRHAAEQYRSLISQFGWF